MTQRRIEPGNSTETDLTPSQNFKNQTQQASIHLGSSKLKIGEPVSFGLSTQGPKLLQDKIAILVEDHEVSAAKKDRKLRSLKKVNQSANSTLNSRGGNKILLMSGTKSKMMERTGEVNYNHNAYYNNEANQSYGSKRPKGQQSLHPKASSSYNTIVDPPGASFFEQYEELQFATYEHATKLRILVETIQQSSMEQELNSCDNCQRLQEALEQVMEIANSSASDFEQLQQQMTALHDRMQVEVAKWKGKCQKQTAKMADQMKEQRKRGRAGKQSHSQCNTRTKEKSLLQQSWIDIANVYDKNRTQMHSFMDEIELVVHEFKHAREKMNLKHLGTMTTVEKEMELLCDSALRSARSQRSAIQQSHRSQSAKKRHSLEGKESKKHQKSANSQPTQFTNDTQATPGKRTSYESKKSPIDSQKKARAQSTALPQKALVPPLPIHIITGNNNQNSKEMKVGKNGGRLSNRSSHRPPPPESFRSHRSHKSNVSANKRDLDPRDSHRSNQRLDTRRSQNNIGITKSGAESQASSRQNISGAIVNGALINPVMLQGAAYQTSKFDKALENDFDGAEATLNFDTGKLKQFTEEYEILKQIEDEDQRILLKQWLFFKYEKEIKQQSKAEKQAKMAQRKQVENQVQHSNLKSKNEGDRNRGQRRTNSNGSNFNSTTDKNGSLLRRPDAKLSQLIDMSALMLDTSLSEIGTLERKFALKHEQLQEAKLSQILAVPNDIPGLKTLTQKELIEIVENNWKRAEQAKQKDRKVLGWSSGEEDDGQNQTNEFEAIVSPTAINVQLISPRHGAGAKNSAAMLQQLANQIKIENELDQEDQSQFHSMLSSLKSQPHQKGDMSSQLLQEDQSFNNESLTFEELEQLTPNCPPRRAQVHQTPLHTDQTKPQPKQKLINPNTTATSDESSFLLQQKKSLEVITEKSEFSNTTYARPGSYRSKKSKQMSSQKNQSSILQPSAVNCREINGSVASLNNSSMINSSRNHVAKAPLKSFAEIQEPVEDIERSHQRRVSGQAVPINHRISIQSQIYQTQTEGDRYRDVIDLDSIEVGRFKTDRGQDKMEAQTVDRAPKINPQQAERAPKPQIVTPSGERKSKDRSLFDELKFQENKQRARAINEKVGGVVILNHIESQKNTSRSYLEKSYLDESDHTSIDHQFALQDRLSSVKQPHKVLRPRDLLEYRLPSDASQSEASDDSPIKGIYRSNSELYLKNIDMQDESDNLFIEINPIIYAPESSPSVPQSTVATRFRIDSSQLNNLTRQLPLHLSRQNITRGPPVSVLDSNTSMQIHTQLYNQLQRLFMQAQQNAQPNGIKNQSMTGPSGNSFKNILSSASKHKTASDPQYAKIGLTVFNHGVNRKGQRQNGLTVSSGLQAHMFNDSDQLQHPEVYKRTLQVLQTLQGQTSHNVNRAVGLLFSNTNVSNNLILTSSIANKSQTGLNPRTPVLNLNKASADTLTSHLPEGKIALSKPKEVDPSSLESFMQSQIAYQSEQRISVGQKQDKSGEHGVQASSKSADRMALDVSSQSLQKKYRLKSSQQQMHKFTKPQERINQKQIFFSRETSQTDQRDPTQSQLTMNGSVSGKSQVLKRINITKLPIKRSQLMTNVAKDTRSQQISIQRTKGVVSACSTQINNHSLVSYNGETSIDLSKIILSGKINKAFQSNQSRLGKNSSKVYENGASKLNANASGAHVQSGNITAGDASLGSQYTCGNLSYSQTNTQHTGQQASYKQHTQHAHSSSIY